MAKASEVIRKAPLHFPSAAFIAVVLLAPWLRPLATYAVQMLFSADKDSTSGDRKRSTDRLLDGIATYDPKPWPRLYHGCDAVDIAKIDLSIRCD
jgi:hypothetical protein